MNKNNTATRYNKSLLAISIAALFHTNLLAQQNAKDLDDEQDVERIIVTATKKATTLQEVPFSINAQTQKDMERAGATNLEELSRNVAGLSIQNLGPGQSQVAIRGVSAGQIVRDQPGVKEQVGVYLDESVISLSLFTPDLDLYDLSRVETLRGPQGTLFGAGSIGGTIRYITNQPQLDEFEGSVEANLNMVTDGEFGGHIKGMINSPLVEDKLVLRAVMYHTKYAGFIDALGENGRKKDDVNGGHRTGGRIALKWQINEQLSITPRLLFQSIDVDGFNRQEVFNLFANPYTKTRPAIQLGERQQYLLLDEQFKDDTTIFDVTTQWTGESIDAAFVYSFTDRDILVSRDASALTGSVSLDLNFPENAALLPSNLRDTTKIKQDTLEFRLNSNDDKAFQWLTGIFYSDTQRDYQQRLPTPGYDAFTDATLGAGTSAAVANGFPADSPFNSDLPYDIKQLAIFGEINYDVNDDLTLTAGTRFYDFEETRDIKTGGLFGSGDNQSDSTKSDGFTSRILASYRLSEKINLNAQISQGFRLGGVNDPLNATLCNKQDKAIFGGFQSYDDETLVNYEFGVKARDKGWTANFAVFRTNIDDLQVTLDAGSCSSRISFNVPEAHTQGLEFEINRDLTDNFNASLAGSYVRAEFDSTVIDSNGKVLGGVAEGNKLASVPKGQFALAGTYNMDKGLWGSDQTYVQASLQYIGSRITQPGDQVAGAGVFSSGLAFAGAKGTETTNLDLELGSYTTINLSAGLVFEDWELVFYANNLLDENAQLSFDRERGGRARLGFRTNQPRTIGATFRMRLD